MNARGELHIFNWSQNTSPFLIQRFAETFEVHVTYDEFWTIEDFLETVRAGNSGLDVVVASDAYVKLLIDERLLAETRPNQMQNFKYLDPLWRDVFWDPGRHYSVPWLWGSTSLAVNTAAFGGEADSLKLMFDPPAELEGKVSVVSFQPSVIQAALLYLHQSPCSDKPGDLDALSSLMLGARSHWLGIVNWPPAGIYSGEAAVAFTFSGQAWFLRKDQPSVKYVYPREGTIGWMDNLVVLKDAPNIENAKLFQNYIMDPEVAALMAEAGAGASGILGSEKFLPDNFANSPEIKPPAEALPINILPFCPPEIQAKYDALWAELTK